ncbi:MAG: type II secretion system minor pseudopilin GspK [Desulfatiglandales bacterium]
MIGTPVRFFHLFVKRQGSALVLTLLVISTLTGLTIAFSSESSLELNLAGYARDYHMAYLAAQSGIHMAVAVLEKDEDKEIDDLDEDWSKMESTGSPMTLPEDTSLSVRIVDETGKFNLNTLITSKGTDHDQAGDESNVNTENEAALMRLFEALGLPENMAAPILDWVDADNIERLEGAENHYYQNLKKPYACANGPFTTTGQVFLVKGMKDIEKFGEGKDRDLLDFLTVYPKEEKININTARKEVLQCLHEKIDAALAESIIERREEQRFSNLKDLGDFLSQETLSLDTTIRSEIQERVTMKSSCFSLEALGRYKESEAAIRAVVHRTDRGMKLFYWRVM